MLDSGVTKQIEDFVYSKPCSVQEIAHHIGRSWRTADRYIDEITRDFGTIATRTFRQGTRGALKIVFWASIEKISSSIFQQRLEEDILKARKREDFSAFDIFQHVPDKNKHAIVEEAIDDHSMNLKELSELLLKTQKQLLIFSGNLTFINLKYKTCNIMEILEILVKRGVKIKTMCRIDIGAKENVQELLSLNFKHGKDLIEIRNKEHPLRAFIIDNKVFRIKEVKEPTGKIKELDKKMFIFYTIKDKEWTEWLSRIFWKMFSNSVGAEKRLKEMEHLRTR